jgi:hypothetical protein
MYSFLILTTNNCQEMPSIESLEDESKLMINIKVIYLYIYIYKTLQKSFLTFFKVDDINDTPPFFPEPTIFESISLDDYKDWSKEVEVNLI